ncbi:MAG TPA: hypothetical protein VLT16_10315 [Candidatus Limnocylindrales bacterium]|nr:hypothetical protein [Candidatus Limnocylindrales bacterium]
MGKIKGLIGLAVIVGGFYVAWNMIPPYFHNYQLQDDLDEIARRNSYTTTNDDAVKKIVIDKAASSDIPLKEDQIIVERTRDGLGISVKYHVHVDMVLHPVDLDFTANSMNKRI